MGWDCSEPPTSCRYAGRTRRVHYGTRGNLLGPGSRWGAIVLAGRLTDRTSPRYVVGGGLACFALSSLLLAFATGTTAFWLLALWLTIGRAGLGLIIPALNVGAVQTLPAEYLAQASAAVNFARQLGGAIGVNLLAVLEWRLGFHDYPVEQPCLSRFLLVVTIAFAAAVVPALSIRKHARVTHESERRLMYKKILVAYNGTPNPFRARRSRPACARRLGKGHLQARALPFCVSARGRVRAGIALAATEHMEADLKARTHCCRQGIQVITSGRRRTGRRDLQARDRTRHAS